MLAMFFSGVVYAKICNETSDDDNDNLDTKLKREKLIEKKEN